MMLQNLFMSLAAAIRFARRLIFPFLPIIFLIGLNIATVVSDVVYDSINRVVWGTVQLVSEHVAERRPKTRTEIEADLKHSRTQLEVAESTIVTTQAELHEAGVRNRSLEAEFDAQKQQISSSAMKTRRLETELDASRLETARIEAALDKAEAEVSRVRRQLNTVKRRNHGLSNQLDASNRRAERMAHEIDLSRQTRSEAIDTASALRSRIVRSIRRESSMDVIESVPFIGTAVFLGSVAYDLNDACHQLRELEALEAILRERELEQIDEAMCLLSYEDMVAAFTGRDRGYAQCVSDRLATNELDPPSCVGYGPAVPEISESSVLPLGEPMELLTID